jgi:PleD family two-component response regulator
VAVAHGADQPIGELIAEADRALYRAKRAGRDRVVAA